jgi:site-specific DNA-cytosine methylase
VFVVGYLGDWRPAAAVLFESESLQRDSKPSRAKRQETPTDAEGSIGTTGNPKISNALCARDYKGPRPEADQGAPVIIEQVAHPIAVDAYNQTINEKTSQTIGSSASDVNHYGAVLEPKAVAGFLPTQGSKAQGVGYAEEQSPTLRAGCDSYGVLQTMAIRRLTPKECERLQGFPDDWTKIPYRNKPADQCPDGPRYKACGNSMAVPVMRWIGTRIQMIENYLNP